MRAQRCPPQFMDSTGGVPMRSMPIKWKKIVDLCLELGINTFDHADIYGGYQCEEVFGEIIKNKRIKTGRHCIVYQMRPGSSSSKSPRCESEIL